MKQLAYITAHTCQCPNQHLLSIGQVCDLCMGVVAPEVELPAASEPGKGPVFDQRYFEELEKRYDDIETAA